MYKICVKITLVVYKKLSKILSLILSLLLAANQLLLAAAVFANETEPAATPSATLAPPTTLESSPSAAPIFTPSPQPSPESTPAPSPTPQPVLTNSDGVYTTETLQLGTTYHFPPNEKVSITFTKLPNGSGTVTVREHDVPAAVKNPASKDYEINSTMPDGSFEFDLILPTSNPAKEVLASEDGKNYQKISNPKSTQSDTITIKSINHLTHFVVVNETADFNHPVINEFLPDGTNEWVELYNSTNQAVNISGWSIDDSLDTGDPFTIPADTIINPGQFLVFYILGVPLNDDGDTVRLFDDFGNFIDSMGHGFDPGSDSIGSSTDGGPDIVTFATPTPGQSNGATLNELFVNANWDSPSNDGNHTWGFDAFATIADAINFAPANATITVEPGGYPLDQTLSIDKRLTLSGPGIGDSQNLATINAICNNIFDINVSNITISGFDLMDEECNGATIIRIGQGVNNTTIENNIIRDGGTGIYIDGWNSPSTNTTIENNQITNNYYGVYLQGDVSGTRIVSNSINQNSGGNGGIYSDSDDLTFSSLDILNNSEITDSSGYGIYFSWFSGTLTISENNISNNYYEGIYLYAENSEAVTISQNTIESNGVDGYSGISISQVVGSTLTIQNNAAISSNGQYGVYIGGVDQDSNVLLDGNTIENNLSSGVYLNSSVTNTLITNNTIQGNSGEGGTTGIVVNNAVGNEAHENIISGNGEVGVQNDDLQEFFDATLNFWGDASGPLDGNLNPNGLGDRVAGRVLFSPFYTDSARSTLTEIEFNASNINLANFDDWGIFDLSEEGEDLVRFVDLLQQFEFEVVENGGENDIVLPEGVRIERSDDLEFDWDSLSLQDVAESLMSGFDSTTAIVDAIQWGLPGVELEFSSPITVRIFVGISFNGQTLNVVRSTSGSGGWTSSGIVAPATCVVTAGICTFQATLASYFAATSTAPMPAPATASQPPSQASGPVAAPTCNDTKPGSAPALLSAAAGVNKVVLGWSKAQDPVTYYLVTYGLGPGLQQYGNPNVGAKDTTAYTVDGLSGGTTYYFRVRAGNGCAPGSFSNELSAKPRGSLVTVAPAPGFTAGVLGITPTPPPVQSKEVPPPPAVSPKPASANILSIFSAFLRFFSRLFGRN